MRPGLHLVVADAPPSRACNARVWLNPGSRGLVKRATLDVATRADARLAERHALLCHSENFESLVVMRLSPDWEMAVRRDDEDGGGRVVLRDVGDAAIVRPGDRVEFVAALEDDPARQAWTYEYRYVDGDRATIPRDVIFQARPHPPTLQTLSLSLAPTFERSPPSPPPESVRMTLTQNWPRLFGRADVLATALSLSKRLFALHWDGRQLRLLRLGAVNEIRVKRAAADAWNDDHPGELVRVDEWVVVRLGDVLELAPGLTYEVSDATIASVDAPVDAPTFEWWKRQRAMEEKRKTQLVVKLARTEDMDTQEDVSAIAASAAAAAPPPPHALTATGKPDGRRRCGACAGCASKGGRCDVLSKRWHANQAKRRRAEAAYLAARKAARESQRGGGDDDDDDESGNATSEEEGGEAVEVGGGDADEPEAEAAAAARAAAALSARRRREDTQNSDGGGGGGGESGGGGGGGGGGESGGGGDDDASLTFRGEKTYVDAVVAIEEKERAAATVAACAVLKQRLLGGPRRLLPPRGFADSDDGSDDSDDDASDAGVDARHDWPPRHATASAWRAQRNLVYAEETSAAIDAIVTRLVERVASAVEGSPPPLNVDAADDDVDSFHTPCGGDVFGGRATRPMNYSDPWSVNDAGESDQESGFLSSLVGVGEANATTATKTKPAELPETSPPPAPRWRATPEQRARLDELFETDDAVPKEERKSEITRELRAFGPIEERNVHFWFANRRREKKKKARDAEAAAAGAGVGGTAGEAVDAPIEIDD